MASSKRRGFCGVGLLVGRIFGGDNMDFIWILWFFWGGKIFKKIYNSFMLFFCWFIGFLDLYMFL